MTTRPSRPLVVCADDFGLRVGISQGIVGLAQAGRVTAISCVANGDSWWPCAPLLGALPPAVSIGLHINLTEGHPLSRDLAAVWPRLPGLPRLIAAAHARLLPMEALRSEVQAQWQAFVLATGAEPRHVDGHQHVHHLPGIRALVLEAVLAGRPAPLLRNTADLPGPGFAVKRWLIRHTGARQLHREMLLHGVAHNASLVGVHDFRENDHGVCMRRWLAALPAQGGWLFCHPALAGFDRHLDPLRRAREREYTYLGSDAFLQDLADADVVLATASGGPAKDQARLIRKPSTSTHSVART